MPTVRQVTQPQIEEILRQVRGAKVVTITAKTDARIKKSSEPRFGGPVYKLSRVNGMINWSYEAAVNRQRDREGKATDFESHPRQWGTRLDGTPFVAHNGLLYLELKIEKSVDEPSYVDVDGNEIALANIQPHLPQRSSSSRQEVDKEIILRDYKMDSITSITFNGTCHILAR